MYPKNTRASSPSNNDDVRAALATMKGEVAFAADHKPTHQLVHQKQLPLTPPKEESYPQPPAHSIINVISGGSSSDFDTKRQRRDYYRSVNHVAVNGPIVHTKWSHVPLTFDSNDLNLRNVPHTDAMVVNCNVAGWEIRKALVDNGSQADIIFLHAFERMGISPKQLQPADNPLFGFRGKTTFPLGKIILPLFFGTGANART